MTDEHGRDGAPPAQPWPPAQPPAQPPAGPPAYGGPGWDQPQPGPAAWAPQAGTPGGPAQPGAQPGWPQAPGQPAAQGYPQQYSAHAGYPQPGYPQPGEPPQDGHAPPAGYAPQDGYAQQAGYAPPAGYAPQGGRPPQDAYAQQGGYAPTGAYPQQGGYPHADHQPGYAPPAGPPTAAYGPGGPGGPGGPWGAAPAGPPPRGPRKRWPIVTALVAVVVIAAGVVLGLTVFRGGGGASTPGEAVTLLATDLADDNYLSALGRLHPAETALAADMSQVVSEQLKRLQVLRPDADPAAALGTVTFTDLRFDEAAQEKVRDNVVINKLVAGKITVNSDASTLPFTDSFKAKAFPNGVPAAGVPSTIDIAQAVAEQREPIRIASVEVDGTWYVSLFYTVADYALRESKIPWPATSIAAKGATSGEEALKQTVQAVLDQDARRLVELAPPEELAVVHDAGQALIDGAGRGTATGAKVVQLETTEQDVRGQRALTLDKVVVADPSGSQFTLTRSGDCVTVEAGGSGSQQLCASQLAQTFGSELAGQPAAVQRLIPKLAKAALDVKVIVVEEGGSWYVSPSRTVVQLYADLLGAFEPGDIDALIAAAPR